MSGVRKIKLTKASVPTLEGAGVHLRRAFSNDLMHELDPFLLLDDFHGREKSKYIKGFPWHPHRGIETITYMRCGDVEHKDSLGNEGVIHPGDVQWMTAGSGIIHQEMPKGAADGHMWGLQLWANLPAAHKMMEPRYRDIRSNEIPLIEQDNGTTIRVICGRVGDVQGPVTDVIIDPQYLDVALPAGRQFEHKVSDGYTAFAYILEGGGYFDDQKDKVIAAETLVVYEKDGAIHISAADADLRFILISGKPIKEPIAWHGPIVMNTQAEIRKALEEYQDGSFLKHKPQ